MTTTINASTSAGLVNSADTSGILQLQTASTAALTIDASQNVGIGTVSPVNRLTVDGGAAQMRLRNTTVRYRSDFAVTSTGLNINSYDDTGAVYLPVTLDGSINQFSTSGTERMRIDSSGNVGIGTSSPTSSNGNVGRITQTASSGNTSASVIASTNGTGIDNAGIFEARATAQASGSDRLGQIYFGRENTSTSSLSSYAAFGTSGSGAFAERMRINSSGNVILGSNTSTTANNVLNLWSPASTLNGIYMQKNGQVEVQIGFKASTNTDFYIGTGSSTMGTNGVYLANTGNSWISVSDVRQKDIIEPIENALTKVNTLRTVIGKYKHDADGVRRSFLIAQDVQAVFPEAVKVQEDEEALLGLSYTDVIPLLVASIKELKAIVDAQAARIATLESK